MEFYVFGGDEKLDLEERLIEYACRGGFVKDSAIERCIAALVISPEVLLCSIQPMLKTAVLSESPSRKNEYLVLISLL